MRWFSTLSISLVLVLAAVGGYYVYYVEARMGMQHEEKLRSLGSVAKLFEKRLESLTTQIRNTPYLKISDLKTVRIGTCAEDLQFCKADALKNCNAEFDYCSIHMEAWKKGNSNTSFYKRDTLESYLLSFYRDKDEEIETYIGLMNQFSEFECIRQEELGYKLRFLHYEGLPEKLIEYVGKETASQRIREYEECLARHSILNRMDSLDAYSFEAFEPIDVAPGKESTGKGMGNDSTRSATYISREFDGENDILVRTVYDAEPRSGKDAPIWDKYDIRVRTSFKSLFSGNLDPDQAFDKILLLNDKHEVLFQGGSPLPRFSDLKTLVTAILNDGRREPIEISGFSDVHKVSLGNKTFYAYIHPLKVFLLNGELVEPAYIEWLTVGLVDESKFRSTTLSVSALPLILFGSLLILGILSGPFIKVVMLGAGEKVTTQDLRNAGLFGIALVGILTILIILLGDYSRIGDHYSNRLAHIAGQFSDSLNTELIDIKEKVISLAAEKSLVVDKCRGQYSDACDKLEEEFISRLVFMDSDGRQEHKFQNSKDRTPSIDVSSRQYFSGPHEMMQVEKFTAENCKFTLESIISYNTGKKYSMMGIPGGCLRLPERENSIQISEGDEEEEEGDFKYAQGLHVASAIVHIKTLEDAYLPVGISYAIINNEGLVLYHSKSNKNLDENLLDEIPERKSFQAIMSVSSHATPQMDITYYGQQYRVHHKYLEFMDAHLLIMQDLSLVDAISLQMAATSYAMFIIYVLFIAAIIIGSILTYGSETASWFWPDNKLSNKNFNAALLLLSYTFWNLTALEIAKGQVAIWLILSQAVLISSSLVCYFERGRGLSYRRVRQISAVFAGISAVALISTNLYMIYCFAGFGDDRAVVSTNAFFGLYCFSMTLTLGTLFCLIKYPDKISPDNWLNRLSLVKWIGSIPLLYRTRGFFYAVVILSMINLSILPAVNIYWDARDAGLLTLLKIEQTAEEDWRANSDYAEDDIFFGGDYVYSKIDASHDDSKEAGEVLARNPPPFFTNLLSFTVRNTWQQHQLDARTRLGAKEFINLSSPQLLDVSSANDHSDIIYLLSRTSGGNIRSFLYPQIPNVKEATTPTARSMINNFVIAGLFFVLLFLFVLYLRWFCRNILGLYSWNQLPVRHWQDVNSDRSCLWLYPDNEFHEMLEEVPEQNKFSINKFINPGKVPDFTPGDVSQLVVITDLEACLLNPAVATQVLYELERQVYNFGRRVIITSNADPLPFIIEDARHLYVRWSHLFSTFDLVQGQPEVSKEFVEKIKSKGYKAHIVNVILTELGWHPDLHRHLETYGERMRGLLEKQCTRLLVNPQKSLCIYLWNLSTNAEKRVLYQLAKGNLVNPSQWDTVLRLQARGLVIRDPLVHLASAGLQRSILQTITKGEKLKLDKPEEVSMWGLIRFPLLVLIGLSVLFLFVTQKDLFDLTIGVAMGAVVALPAVTRLFAMLGNSSSGGSKDIVTT